MRPKIILDSVSVSFPVYNASARSIKNQFLRLTTGGRVLQDANKHIIVNALDNINLEFHEGDVVGLIGHNGAGKSTLLRLVAGIYEPVKGKITVNGRVSSLLDIMHGLEAESTGYENILIRGIILGLTKKQIEQKVDAIAEFTELGDYLAMPIRTYSAGMQVRLAFGIATSITPDVLLIDEVFGAGDAAFMNKAQQRMESLLHQSNLCLFASHSEDTILKFCNKGLVLEHGKVKFFGPTADALEVHNQQQTVGA